MKSAIVICGPEPRGRRGITVDPSTVSGVRRVYDTWDPYPLKRGDTVVVAREGLLRHKEVSDPWLGVVECVFGEGMCITQEWYTGYMEAKRRHSLLARVPLGLRRLWPWHAH